jgi:putative SOS response-associated peptidase YedK
MCGRNSLFVPQPELEDRFDATFVGDSYSPRYNIAPSDSLDVITNDTPDAIDRLYWGLIPHWADEIESTYINARSETVDEKRPFQNAWESRPCLVLSSGFYEWKDLNGGSKQPYRVYRTGDSAFAMAGLWQRTTIDEQTIQSVTILTTEPNDVIRPIHDRMPVILSADEEDVWLTSGPETRKSLCQPYPDDDLEAYPISSRVNNPQNDSPEVIDPVDTEQSDLGEW